MSDLNQRLEAKIDKLHTDIVQLNTSIAELRLINLRHDELSRENSVRIDIIEKNMHEMQGAIRLGKFVGAFLLSCIVGVMGWVVKREENQVKDDSTLKEQFLDARHQNERQDERIKYLEERLRELP